MTRYALFLDHIVTANEDGSIPPDAKVLCKVDLVGAFMPHQWDEAWAAIRTMLASASK